MSNVDTLKTLLNVQTAGQVRTLIANVGSNWAWKPLGGKENAGIIEMGSEPGDALAERITNGIDALLERKYLESKLKVQPASPKDAVSALLAVKDGKLSSLTDVERRKLAENLCITLFDSSEQSDDALQKDKLRTSPTIAIVDQGIGQNPKDFESTLLSINAQNKVGKKYLLGSYGQGGSTVYGFSEFTIIVSRRAKSVGDSENKIGFTIIRCNHRDPNSFKRPVYEYCLSPNQEVLEVDATSMPAFQEGTYIKIIQFDMPQHSTIYSAPQGSLWWLSHYTLFDSVLPFIIRDTRSGLFPGLTQKADGETGKVINGNKYRLASKKYPTHAWEINLGEYGKINVTYWVMDGDKEDLVNYVKKTEPIVFTLNGQRQISISKTELALKGRDFVKDRLVVHITADEMTPEGQRVFSSTRDRARKNQAYLEIIDQLKKNLMADEFLKKLDEQFREKALSKESEEQTRKAQEMLAKLLDRQSKQDEKLKAVFSDDPILPVISQHEEQEREDENTDEILSRRKLEPKTELKYIPTLIEVLNKKQTADIEKGYGGTVRIFIDAVDEYFKRDESRGGIQLTLNVDDGHVQQKSISDLRSGIMSIRFEVDNVCRAGSQRVLTIEIARPGQSPLIGICKLIVTPPQKRWRKNSGNNEKPQLKLPRFVYVSENDDNWNSFGWTKKDVAEYKDNIIFVSISNDHYESTMRSVKSETSIDRYKTKYAAHIGFYTIMQSLHEESLDTELPDGYRKKEMERAARMILQTIATNIEESNE